MKMMNYKNKQTDKRAGRLQQAASGDRHLQNGRLWIFLFSLFFIFFGPKLHAQLPNNQGFNTPGTGFGSNPFGNRPSSADEEEDLDEDEEDLSQEMLRNRMDQRLKDQQSRPNENAESEANAPSFRNQAPGTPSSTGGIDFSEVGQEVGATSVQAGAKIIPGGKTNCLKLDPYTGIGPDVISNFDFPDADIVEIAKTLGRLTCLNFILDKDVRGRISIVSNAPITVGDAWKAFLTALDVNNFALIPSGKYLRIARQRDAKDKQIRMYTGGVITPDNDMLVTKILPLKYLVAEDVIRVFRNFQPPNARMIPYEQTNTIIITDTGSDIKKLVDMIEMLDIESFDETLEVLHIKYAAAQDIAKLIDQLLPGIAGSGGGLGGGAPMNVPRFRSGFAARRTKEGGLISHIIPDDRTNSVIVSANAKGLEQVKELLMKLDSKISATLGGSKIHVIYLQFADAEQVAQTLNNLASGAGAKPTTPPPLTGTATSGSTTTQLFEGAIKIAADKATNALVITGTPTDFATIERVIAKLDVPRDQVYVEAVIMEMQLNKEISFGTAIANPTNGIGFLPGTPDLAGAIANPLGVTGLALGFKAGNQTSLNITSGSGTTTVPVYSVMGLVQALQKNGAANVLSTPQILTLDNQEATIEVGNTIPLPQTSFVGATNLPQQSFTREKIGLKLTIKPQINKISDFVKLEVDQKISTQDPTPPPAQVAGFAIGTKERASKSTIVVQNGDTVAIGGLMRDEVLDQVTKVPLLGDIPIIGWLFKSKNSKTTKLNLLSLITPKIIKQYPNMRKILDSKIRERDEFIEKNAGGEDPYEDYKLKTIKELPPVSELKQGTRVESAAITPTEESQEEPSAKLANPQQPVIMAPPPPAEIPKEKPSPNELNAQPIDNETISSGVAKNAKILKEKKKLQK